MPTFGYLAFDSRGKPVQGSIEADDYNDAASKLGARGLTIKELSESGKTSIAGAIRGTTIRIWNYRIRPSRGLVRVELNNTAPALKCAVLFLSLMLLLWYFKVKVQLWVFVFIGIFAIVCMVSSFFGELWELTDKRISYSMLWGGSVTKKTTLEGDLKLSAVVKIYSKSASYYVIACDESFHPTKLRFSFLSSGQMEQFLKCISESLNCQIQRNTG